MAGPGPTLGKVDGRWRRDILWWAAALGGRGRNCSDVSAGLIKGTGFTRLGGRGRVTRALRTSSKRLGQTMVRGRSHSVRQPRDGGDPCLASEQHTGIQMAGWTDGLLGIVIPSPPAGNSMEKGTSDERCEGEEGGLLRWDRLPNMMGNLEQRRGESRAAWEEGRLPSSSSFSSAPTRLAAGCWLLAPGSWKRLGSTRPTSTRCHHVE